QPVITPATADRAETNRAPLFVLGVEQEFYFVDRTGVIFETADDGRIDTDAIRSITRCCNESLYLFQLGAAFLTILAFAQANIDLRMLLFGIVYWLDDASNQNDVGAAKSGTLREVTGFVLAPFAQQLL